MPENFDQPCPSGRYWIVGPGDTFANIAYYFKIPISELLLLNPQVNPMNLQPGMRICLPLGVPMGPTVPCPSGRYYTVRPGDTFWKIAYSLGTTANILMQLNPNIDPTSLRPGMNICIP